ncbi:mannitol-1-phosphate 5-dehydrogenase [Periweissella fabalis]|uniref:Mannitol-1-phosphate 5-dehydrogenase n=1 Tax=Periweissella fabalis TaxID=1070421 RepID=A0A7X6N233_9LACO|nr:mannitol-1-phosphate 5-dehydrogenase [Periweissella fabalis]MCM0599391.1 mannitol-1-phosphate 5-dehydrogenase [Periweissella fabalis]NKZ23670.1 mannitol-1-phosphate 5-dehydrogenase [Periweissella fabalis]
MKQAVHFGAGNIGRGFIGEILHQNDFEIAFVDVNETIIDALNTQKEYDIELASDAHESIHVNNVRGINNAKKPEEVITAIVNADVVTTAIGPNILPFIAQLLAQGIHARRIANNATPLDVIACENMIGGSQFFLSKVKEYLDEADLTYVNQYIGFPNAAVDRIVPNQANIDPLHVIVEPFCEWVVDESQMKNKELQIKGVHYANDLEPFIERKLFSVNTGHATVAYNGAAAGYTTITEALTNADIMATLRQVQAEIRALLLAKFDFTETDLVAYHDTICERFANPYIVDKITRVGRTPIRKLGYDERFIRPIRELNARNLPCDTLIATVGKIFTYQDKNDQQAVELQAKLLSTPLTDVIKDVTSVTDVALISKLEAAVKANLKVKN